MGVFYGVSPQNGIAVGLGSIIALGVPATGVTPPPAASYLLLEDNSFVLLEDNSKIELE